MLSNIALLENGKKHENFKEKHFIFNLKNNRGMEILR